MVCNYSQRWIGCLVIDFFFFFFFSIWRTLADNLKNGRFHQHLRDTFAPQVVRYVDLMESSIAQSIHKGFEKEKWEIKGWWKTRWFWHLKARSY
jgi:hypothetical protein